MTPTLLHPKAFATCSTFSANGASLGVVRDRTGYTALSLSAEDVAAYVTTGMFDMEAASATGPVTNDVPAPTTASLPRELHSSVCAMLSVGDALLS
mmetsp:Transcript_7386/g.17377  ORF Transcript_7386/g.17377 Transcript_7386/m.17377 type:complete len:96 (+) Transcript_7386:41-328(+)